MVDRSNGNVHVVKEIPRDAVDCSFNAHWPICFCWCIDFAGKCCGAMFLLSFFGAFVFSFCVRLRTFARSKLCGGSCLLYSLLVFEFTWGGIVVHCCL